MQTKISLIHGWLARYLQSLDVCINKPLKDELKKRCTKYCKYQKDIRQGNSRRYDKLGRRDFVWW